MVMIHAAVSVLLLAISLPYIVMNSLALYHWARKIHYRSPVPLLPGLFGAIALYIFPYYPLRRYAWVPLLVDPGCLPCLVIYCVVMSRQLYATNPFFRVACFRSAGQNKPSVRLLLYRPSLCIIQADMPPPPKPVTYPHTVSISRTGDWSVSERELTIDLGDTKLVYELPDASDESPGPDLKWVSSSAPTHFDGIDLRVVGRCGLPESNWQ